MSECFEFGSDFSLLRLVPTVLRARDFRLYTAGNRRIVDMWQNGGAAILGHTPPSLLRELKNTASRGLYAPLPHFLENRCRKALSIIFPGREIRIYASPPPWLESMISGGSVALWRPFLDPDSPLAVHENSPPVLVPVVPGIQSWRMAACKTEALPHGFCALAIDIDNFSAEKNSGADVLPGDFISPLLLSVATRGIYDIIAAAHERAKPAFPRIAKVIKSLNGIWQCHGPYLVPEKPVSKEKWKTAFCRFLESDFLLPPVPSQPVILPGTMSPGEEAKFAKLLSAWS
jgi:hypothetical protein